MKRITLLVLYLQGYDAGQKCLKISTLSILTPAATDPYKVIACNYTGF